MPEAAVAAAVRAKAAAAAAARVAPVGTPVTTSAGAAVLNPDAVTGGDPGARTMSDRGNGRRVGDVIGANVRYTPGMEWHVWNSEYWVPDEGGLWLAEMAKDLPTWVQREAAECTDSDRQEALLKHAARCTSGPVRDRAVKEASSDPRVLLPASRWDADPYLLGVKNGVVDLRTGVLESGAREHYMTKQIGVEYSPSAAFPRWNIFLEQVTGGDAELARYLQLAAGYTLTGLRKYECLFLVYGPPGSGKSTFLDVLSALMGSYGVGFAADVLTDSGYGPKSTTEYWLARLVGARMLLVSELPESVAMQEDAVKRLTGDSMINARHPAGRPFSFEAQAKLWIGTNHRPWVRDSAMWRRIRAIPFEHVPASPDPGLKEMLLDPARGLPAVLSWAVEGAVRLLASGDPLPLRVGASRVVEEATAAYKDSEDRIGQFLKAETDAVPGTSIGMGELFFSFGQWCEAANEKPGSLNTFARKLEEAGEKVVGMGRRAVVEGRRIKPVVVPSAGAEGSPWSVVLGEGAGE